MLYFSITNLVLFAFIISLHNYNNTIIKELISFDYIAKIKIKGKGNQAIVCPEISSTDNQKYPDEIYIEKDNEIIKNITEGIYKIDLEEDENTIIMKWNTYPNSARRMFKDCANIIEIDLSLFNLEAIANMGNMFLNCYNLNIIKFGDYSTSALNYTYGMFNGCRRLASLDLSMFDTSKVVNMEFMFSNCYALKSLNLSNFKTSNVKSFAQMFRKCENLETLDLFNFDTSLATNISYMFSDCKRLSNLTISSFDISNIKDMSYLFNECKYINFNRCFKFYIKF